MRGMSRARVGYAAVFLALAGVSVSEMSAAQERKEADGTIEFTGGSVAIGIGYAWGSGTLYYKGKQFPFTASGFSLADVGATQNKVTGEVYQLSAVEEFAGTYSVAQTGAALVGGGGVGYLQNERGVIIKVVSSSQGARLSLGTGGVTIAMK